MSGFNHFDFEWFDPYGPFAPLHQINATRLNFVLSQFNKQPPTSCLDVGCGAGIFMSALASALPKATHVGIDASSKAIALAKHYACLHQLSIDYREQQAEAPIEEKFELITCLELIEHLADPQKLIEHLANALVPHGQLIVSTLNRTCRSFIQNIALAEDLLGVIPPGTHDFRQFIKPHELSAWAQTQGLTLHAMAGIVINPVTYQPSLSQTHFDNYIMAFKLCR